jgi:hypothetical protein
MTGHRKLLLRANALFLGIAAAGGMVSDLRGAFQGEGPIAVVLGSAPHAAIGFVEAHGLALIFAVLLWRAPAERAWNLTAAAIHALLGVSNIAFWPLFAASGMLAVGYVTTALHIVFFVLQASAAATAGAAKVVRA